jgi:hypothetical protein
MTALFIPRPFTMLPRWFMPTIMCHLCFLTKPTISLSPGPKFKSTPLVGIAHRHRAGMLPWGVIPCSQICREPLAANSLKYVSPCISPRIALVDPLSGCSPTPRDIRGHGRLSLRRFVDLLLTVGNRSCRAPLAFHGILRWLSRCFEPLPPILHPLLSAIAAARSRGNLHGRLLSL